MDYIVSLFLSTGGVAIVALSRVLGIPASEFRPYQTGESRMGRTWLLIAGGAMVIAGLGLLVLSLKGFA